MILRTALGVVAASVVLAGCGSGGTTKMPSVAPLGLLATCGDWQHASAERQQTTARADLAAVRQMQQPSVQSSTPDPPSDDQVVAIVPAITRSCTAAGDTTLLVTVFNAVAASQPSYYD